jgi:hypothetical protein
VATSSSKHYLPPNFEKMVKIKNTMMVSKNKEWNVVYSNYIILEKLGGSINIWMLDFAPLIQTSALYLCNNTLFLHDNTSFAPSLYLPQQVSFQIHLSQVDSKL